MGPGDSANKDPQRKVSAESGEPNLRPFQLSEFHAKPATEKDDRSDIELDLRIQLGHTSLNVTTAMQLRQGSVVPLDQTTEEPVEIYANEQLVALGEILVLNEKFCVRVTDLLGEQSRRQAG